MLGLAFLIGKVVFHRRLLFTRCLQLGRLKRLFALDEVLLFAQLGDLLPKLVGFLAVIVRGRLLDFPLVRGHPLDLGQLLLRHLLPVLRLTFLIGKFVRHRRILFLRGLQLGRLAA